MGRSSKRKSSTKEDENNEKKKRSTRSRKIAMETPDNEVAIVNKEVVTG